MNKEIFMNLLQAREYKAVRSILNVMNAVDIAALMEELEDKDLALAFRLIPKDKAAEVFANMNSPMQSYLVEIFTEKELKRNAGTNVPGRHRRSAGGPPGQPGNQDS